MGHTVTVRLSEELAVWLKAAAARAGVSRSQLIRDQLEKARASGEAQGFLRLAGAVSGPKDLSCRKGFRDRIELSQVQEMADPSSDVARRAAARLADLDPRLPAYTERALAGGGGEARTRSFDPATAIALAGLLVSMVQAGWSMWRDVKEDREKDREKAARAVVARRLRLAFPDPRGVSTADRDRMIEAVLDELEAPQCHPERV